MNILIVTDDSGVKLPHIDRYRNRIGKGVNISEYGPFMKVLKENGLDVPSDDLEKEEGYMAVLSEFIRPARLMFAGMFGEVRLFSERLSERYAVNLGIISGRYGLISGDTEIIPYDHHIDTEEKIVELDRRTKFISRLSAEAENHDYILLFLNKEMLSSIFSRGFLTGLAPERKVIAVTSRCFRDLLNDAGHVYLPRRGVARIGKENQKKIIHILEGA